MIEVKHQGARDSMRRAIERLDQRRAPSEPSRQRWPVPTELPECVEAWQCFARAIVAARGKG